MNKEKLSLVQNIIDEAVKTNEVPGINCLVTIAGQEVGYFEAGYANIESQKPVVRDSLFRLYSMSKTITSVAVMIAVEQGLINIDDKVSKYLPSYANPQVEQADGTLIAASKEVTIADLMSMTSGIPYPNVNSPAEIAADKLMKEIVEKMDSEDALSTVEIANRTGSHPLRFNPDSHWEYGFSADILGAVVEVASKMRYSDFLSKYIFEPLDMIDTAFYVPKDKISRLVNVYAKENAQLKLYTYPNLGVSNHMTTPPAFESGGAGLVSCIDDSAKFAHMLLNNGEYNGKRIISKKSIEYISTPITDDVKLKDLYTYMPHLKGYAYSNLMRIMIDPAQSLTLASKGEYGWDGWLGTYMAVDPANDMVIVLMQQLTDTGTSDLTRKIRNAIYSALE